VKNPVQKENMGKIASMIVGVRTVLDAILQVGSVTVSQVGEESTVTHLAIKIDMVRNVWRSVDVKTMALVIM